MRSKLIPLLALLMLAFPAAAAANPRQFSIFEAPRELLKGSDQLRQSTLDEIRGFGVHWLRVVMYWRHVAPQAESHHVPSFDETDPSQYDWGNYDTLINEARAKGFRILLTVTAPAPTWATYHHSDEQGTHRPSVRRYKRFMTAVGRHYADDVDYWSIWNEPNHPQFLRPQFKHGHPISGKIYRRLFRAGFKGIHATDANDHDKVLAGETAPVGTSHVVAPLKFMQQALCLNRHYKRRHRCHRGLPAWGWAHHAYTRKPGPYYHDRSHPRNVVIGDLHRMNRALRRAGRTGAIRRRAGIYLTEFGIQSKPDPFYGVGYHKQAEYRSISEYIAYHNHRVKAFSQYLMRDSDPLPTSNLAERYSGFESGLRRSDGRKKRPTYNSYPIPLVALKERHHRRVELWGYLRPADDQDLGRQAVRIEYRNRHSRRWHRLKYDHTNRHGYWVTHTRYHRGRKYRIRWTDDATGRTYRGPTTRVHREP